ncbi:conserved hypothetical protein [Cupriavidus taiwanensis]|nr:conserved hypothetical protein [Cupriavidus taiwanensis]
MENKMSESLNAARIQTVRDHMALECTHEWDAVIDTFAHPRYEMHATGTVFDGEEEVRGYFDSSRAAFPDLANEIIAIAAADDTVLVEFWLSGTHLGDLKANGKVFAPTGRKFRVRMAATFEFAPNSDKIICERPYSATDAKLRALGLL